MAFYVYPPTPGTTLPVGAATAANQVLEIAELQDIDAGIVTLNAKDFATETTLSALDAKVTACNTGAVVVASSALPTGAATESTLASIASKTIDTDNVTVVASALPTGAATETTLSALNAKVTACNTGAVTVAASALPTGASTESTLSTLNGKVTACDTDNVTVAASALPTGAATETTLASIDAKTPALGQAAMSASVPVAIANNQSAIPVLLNSSLVPLAYDAIDADLSGGTTDVYEYYTGGLAGTLVATLTITYTDASKVTLQSVVRT